MTITAFSDRTPETTARVDRLHRAEDLEQRREADVGAPQLKPGETFADFVGEFNEHDEGTR